MHLEYFVFIFNNPTNIIKRLEFFNDILEESEKSESRFKYLFFEILTPEEYNDVIFLGRFTRYRGYRGFRGCWGYSGYMGYRVTGDIGDTGRIHEIQGIQGIQAVQEIEGIQAQANQVCKGCRLQRL